MKMNFVKSVLLVSIFTFGLISCGKIIVSTDNDLVGNWESTQVDSLIHFVVPQGPDTLISSDYKTNHLEINEDGSFRMIDSIDTIIGDWNQSAVDTLMLTIKDIQGNILYNRVSKIENVDSNELVLVNFGGSVSEVLHVGHTEFSTTKKTKYEAKVYYVRKM